MNKIFKVIWSKSKQCYVVVSELAKNTTGKKKIVVASIFAAMVAGQAMQVDATSGSFYDTGAIKGAIAIGKAGSTAPQATDENAIAIGQAARANGRGGVALGNDTRSAQNAIAAAWDSQATGKKFCCRWYGYTGYRFEFNSCRGWCSGTGKWCCRVRSVYRKCWQFSCRRF